ncbi:MAG: hypothetical protein PHD48_09600 [Alphaproteobacteria bacterium]|nr:hypothetical protein [Alphaproteobacteria bacterium]
MDKEAAALLAKTIVLCAFRNTSLEDLHAGTFPDSKTGDYSDVKVVTPYGEIPWVRTSDANKASRLNNEEMRTLMKEAVNKVFTILLRLNNLDKLAPLMKNAEAMTAAWDAPEELVDWNAGEWEKKLQEIKKKAAT